VDAQISTLRKAGLNPYLMDLKPLALARTITEPKAIIIDLQPTSFDIVVMAEGVPQVVRSLSLTRQALMEEKVPVLRDELGRAITFYNSSHMDKPIDAAVPLLVCGELADQPDTWKLLLGRQERPVQMLPLPMETPEGFPSGQYVTNIGLALKELLTSEKGAIAYSLVNLNALPEIYIPKPRPISEILFIPTIIAGIALVALGAFFNISASAYTTALRNELAAIDQMTLSRQVRAEDMMALTGEVSSLEQRADGLTTTVRDLKAGRDKVNGDLGQINSCLPGAVDLEGVTHSGDTLTVKGLADDEDAIFRYAKDLRASGRFAMVVITEMREEVEVQQTSFTLTLIK
jgi:type IV pilus assembly protein PilM